MVRKGRGTINFSAKAMKNGNTTLGAEVLRCGMRLMRHEREATYGQRIDLF